MAVSAVSRLAPVITPLELSTNTREIFTVTFHGLFMSFVYVYLLKCPLTVKLREGSLTALTPRSASTQPQVSRPEFFDPVPAHSWWLVTQSVNLGKPEHSLTRDTLIGRQQELELAYTCRSIEYCNIVSCYNVLLYPHFYFIKGFDIWSCKLVRQPFSCPIIN